MSVRSGGDSEKEEAVLFYREANLCGAAVEAQCYAPGDKTVRGTRVPTKHVCCHCYADSNLARDKDVEDRETRGGQAHRPMCKSCLASGVPVVYTKRAKKKSGGGIKGEKKQEKRWAGGTSRKEKDKECNQFLV